MYASSPTIGGTGTYFEEQLGTVMAVSAAIKIKIRNNMKLIIFPLVRGYTTPRCDRHKASTSGIISCHRWAQFKAKREEPEFRDSLDTLPHSRHSIRRGQLPHCCTSSTPPPLHSHKVPRMANADHPFQKPGPGDGRSPCPALNALANHGFL